MSKHTLILLPGLDGTGDLFEPFIAALGSEVNVKVVRYPVAEALGYQDLEVLVRQALPVSEPFVLLGESFSGPIAISIAAEPPPNLVATILCCTFISNPQPRLAAFRWLLPLANPRFAPLAVISSLLMGKYATVALRSTLASTLAKVSTAVFLARLGAIFSVNVAAKLAKVQVPVMYLQALQDRLIPAQESTKVLKAYPIAHVVKLEGPHFLLQVCPKQAANEVCSFLSSLQNSI